MKLLVIFHDNNIYSGASRSMITLIEKWVTLGIDIVALTPGEGEVGVYLQSLNIHVIKIPKYKFRISMSKNFPVRLCSRLYSVYCFAASYVYCYTKLSKLIRRLNVDAIYSNTTSTCVGYYLQLFLKKPHIWHIREFGKLDQNCEYGLGFKMLCKHLNNADLIIGISKSVKEYYNKYLNKNIVVVYNDVSSDYLDNFPRDWNEKELVLLSCGSLIPGKGHEEVIKAAYELNKKGLNIRLLIAGDGDNYRQYLESLIHKIKADNYIFLLGQVKDINSIRRKCHIGIVASKSEAFGRVTIEGMLSGLLIIASNAGANPEIIVNDVNGLLYKSGDYYNLADIITKLYYNRTVMKTIAKKGQEYASRYTKGDSAISILKHIKPLTFH